MNPFSLSKWALLFENSNLFFEGALYTIAYSIVGLLVACSSGIILALFNVSNNKILSAFSKVVVRLAQNIPQVIMIFFLYNVFPMIGIVMSVFQIGVWGVGIYQGAFISETFRAGIEAIPVGQWEAAQSQGLSYLQTLRLVILPQMFKSVLPSFTNNVVNFIKNTSVMAMIAGGEIMYVADSWSSYNMAYGPAYAVTALIYFIICFPLSSMAKRMEKQRQTGGKLA